MACCVTVEKPHSFRKFVMTGFSREFGMRFLRLCNSGAKAWESCVYFLLESLKFDLILDDFVEKLGLK